MPRCAHRGFTSELPRRLRCYACGREELFRVGGAVIKAPEPPPDPPAKPKRRQKRKLVARCQSKEKEQPIARPQSAPATEFGNDAVSSGAKPA
jgi:hypothetical protein